jgi:aspartate/methionine/tyrosine aminotransferase
VARRKGETRLNANPALIATAVPPIPEAKGWLAEYRGNAGPPIDLSQAVPGYPPPEAMLSRLSAVAGTAEAASYGDILGDVDLRAILAAHVSGLYEGMIAADEVAITAGCNMAFMVAVMALAKAGEAVMLPTPWYFNHKMTLDMLGIAAIALPCRAEKGFVPAVEDTEPLIDGRVRAIVLVTPNNPTGAAYPPPTIHAFADLCSRRGIALILDETYRDFIDPGAGAPHRLFADDGWRKTVVQLYSFSKAYCIPGHRSGAMLADRRLIAEIAKILDCIQISPPRVPQRALVWAIPALADWRAASCRLIIDRAAAFRSAIAACPGWSAPSVGAYFGYLRHPAEGRSGAEVAKELARECGVLTLPGSYFGDAQEPFLRAAFANVGEETIEQLPARLAGFRL